MHLLVVNDVILLAEAICQQVYVIKNCLDLFYLSEGKFCKFDLLVSKNVNDDLAQTLSNILGIPLKAKLGKYLGVPSLQKQAKKGIYGQVIKRV